MATKTDQPGLLSKMALFVRNPTKDWAELDRPQPEQDSGYDKQALKAMIERKRQNDFIRKREFDQLRKLRSRGTTTVSSLARPSVFQTSTATDPDGRAVTLKKIDEIEAQMSRQWWKGKQDAAAASAAAAAGAPAPSPGTSNTPRVPPANVPLLSDEMPGAGAPAAYGPTAPMTMPTDAYAGHGHAEFAPTEMGDGMEPAPAPKATNKTGKAQPPKSVPILGALAQHYDGVDVGFSTSKLFALDVEDMATDPELEEAAIRFANGDDEGAESGLIAALQSDNPAPEAAASWAAALLDLYRATGNKERFDWAVQEFSRHFETLLPQWVVIGDNPTPAPQPGEAESAVAPEPDVPEPGPDYAQGAIWCSPAELTADALEQLRDAMASNPTPWHLDWTQLRTMAANAMPLMSGLFSSLCDEPVSLRFSGATQLVDTLRIMMPAGDASVDPAWWAMRMNALRTLNMPDDFELAALDYCVTYEVSPPAWDEARCQLTFVEEEMAAQAAQTAQQAGVRIETTGWSSGYNQMPTAPLTLEPEGSVHLDLKGEVLGDATEALSSFDPSTHEGDTIVVSCKALVRVDFSAAGSILNWVAMRQSEGCHVQFRDVQRLVAAFFNVIGINEHARVVPRPT